MQLQRSDSYHQYYFEVGRGFECKSVCESLGEFVSQRTLDIAGTASFESRQTADRRLMEQGLVVISESELKSTTKLGAGETSIVFAGTYKGIDVAVKNYLVFNYSYAVKEYQILTILNSHPNIPHPFGVVRGDIPKLVMSLPTSSVALIKVKLDSEENLCRLTAGLVDAVIYMHQNGILHNNLNCKNILVNTINGTPTICGFSHACLENDAYIIPQPKLVLFGEECCLPAKVKNRTLKVSAQSDIYCLGYTLRWHTRGQYFPDSKVCLAVSSFAAECLGLISDRPMTKTRLAESAAEFSRLMDRR